MSDLPVVRCDPAIDELVQAVGKGWVEPSTALRRLESYCSELLDGEDDISRITAYAVLLAQDCSPNQVVLVPEDDLRRAWDAPPRPVGAAALRATSIFAGSLQMTTLGERRQGAAELYELSDRRLVAGGHVEDL